MIEYVATTKHCLVSAWLITNYCFHFQGSLWHIKTTRRMSRRDCLTCIWILIPILLGTPKMMLTIKTTDLFASENPERLQQIKVDIVAYYSHLSLIIFFIKWFDMIFWFNDIIQTKFQSIQGKLILLNHNDINFGVYLWKSFCVL